MDLSSKYSLSKQTSSKSNVAAGLLAGMIMSVAGLYAPVLNAAPIYKIVDERTGQVTFTDRPQNYEQQVGKQITDTHIIDTQITTNPNTNNPNTNSRSGNVSSTPNQTTGIAAVLPPITAAATAKSPRVNYQLIMREPSEERAYRRPAQSINVTVQIKPTLQAGDHVIVYLDGKEVAQGLSASIATVDILPGAHTLKAVVKNETGHILKQIERTVYVIQNSIILQNNKKIAQQRLAYQRLPWHQKILLKLRPDTLNTQQAIE